MRFDLQILGQILSAKVAAAYTREKERWLQRNWRDDLVQVIGDGHCDVPENHGKVLTGLTDWVAR